MAVVMLGPIIAVIGMWFLAQEQAQRANALIFAAVGVAGVLASVFGVISPDPFLLPTNAFFSMVATLDTFAAMFIFPFSLVMLALGVEWYVHRKTQEQAFLTVFGIALLSFGMTWLVLSTNILGVLAALMLLMCAEACVVFKRIRMFVVRGIGVLFIAAGLFILSSGALFNDFATLAYIAAELDFPRLIGAFSAIVLGVLACSGAWPFARMASADGGSVPGGAIRALMQTAWFLAPLYLFLRLLLFVFPPLDIWFALPVGLLGIMTILSVTRYASKRHAFGGISCVHGVGFVLFMLSATMLFQSLNMYEAMNIVLFATIIQSIGVVLGGNSGDETGGGIEYAISGVARLGVPLSLLFVSQWMFGSVMVLQFTLLPRTFALALALGFLIVLGSLVRQGYAIIENIRTAVHAKQRFAWRNVAAILTSGFSVVGAVFVPFALYAIGAEPLTQDAQTWQGAVVAGGALLRPAVLALGIMVCSLAYWALRDKTLRIEMGNFVDAKEQVHAPVPDARIHIFFREVRKLCIQYIAVPAQEQWRTLYAWHDRYVTRVVTPSLVFMMLAVILTFAIAL